MPVTINKLPETPAPQPDADQKGHRVNMMYPDALYQKLLARSTETGLTVPMLLRFAAVAYVESK
ncbi:hypothetical protein EVC45_10230 [Paraburkholderia sp. UYCP14C]|uniref:hypothetical protein n=1 Tax=Paraburkholderia sp. UYCP14C TaxID=2511130 RepID=UPI0010201BAD|nr:hypothetical protein [Paraburkholderia sp. UYCP14C]RZF29966.1 hypothetical protein EVC45_10230 [Paraburkholderia sp. UYCP14C]